MPFPTHKRLNEMNGHDAEDLRLGMRATFSNTIAEADIVLFAGVSGDNNAVHINEEFAPTTRFGGRIAHGFLTASVISAAAANRLPGPGTIYLCQQLNFRAPVRPGQTVHACVSASAIDRERRRVSPHAVYRVGETVVIDGQALVMTTSSAKRQSSLAAVAAAAAAADVSIVAHSLA
jgi:3-hydroxybutyryl-CoA dehydratase